MRHLVYDVRYSVVPINSTVLAIHYTPRLEQHSFITTRSIRSLSWRYNRARLYFDIFVFFQCHHMSFCGLRGPPSWAWHKSNRLLRLGRPSGAVTLSRWCVSGDRGGCSIQGGTLNLNSINLPRPWSLWESSPSRKIPTVEPGIEPGNSWLVVRDSDH